MTVERLETFEEAIAQVQALREREEREARQCATVLSAALGLFFEAHDRGDRPGAVRLLFEACDLEYEHRMTCDVSGAVATGLGYDDELEAYGEARDRTGAGEVAKAYGEARDRRRAE